MGTYRRLLCKSRQGALVIVPLPEFKSERNSFDTQKGKAEFNNSLAVRKKDKDRMEMIQGALDRNQSKILKILDDYGIPHVPVVLGDKTGK